MRKFARKHKAGLASLSIVVMVLVTSTVVSSWQSIRATQAESLAEQRFQQAQVLQREAELAHTNESVQRQLAQVREYDANALLIQSHWEQSSIPRFVSLLEAQRAGPGAIDHRGFEWHYWWNLLHHSDLIDTHSATVRSVDVSSDGQRLASGTGDTGTPGQVLIRNLATRQVECRFSTINRVNKVVFGADSKFVAAACGDNRIGVGTVYVWNLTTGKQVFRETLANSAQTVAFSPNGKWLAAGSIVLTEKVSRDLGEWKVWEWEKDEEIFSAEGELEGYWDLAFHPNGQQIAAGVTKIGELARVKIWDLSTGKTEHIYRVDLPFIFELTYSPDGSRLAAATSQWNAGEGVVRMWDTQTGHELPRQLRGHPGRLTCARFNHDGSRMATAGQDRTIAIWNLENGRRTYTFRGHASGIETLAFTPDSQGIVSGDGDGEVRLWDASTSQVAKQFNDQTMDFQSVAFSADGALAAIGGGGGHAQSKSRASPMFGNVVVRNVHTNDVVFDLHNEIEPVYAVAISPDGTLLAIASGETSGLGSVDVWDLVQNARKYHFESHTAPAVDVAFSSDGSRLVSIGGAFWGAQSEAKVWDLNSGQEIPVPEQLNSGLVYDVCFHPRNAHQLAIVGVRFPRDAMSVDMIKVALEAGSAKGVVTVWDFAQGRETFQLDIDGSSVMSVAFSGDGSRLAAGCADSTIKVWDLNERAEIHTLKGHTGRVHSVSFSPDGSRLASSGQSSNIKLWDLITGQEVLTLTDHISFVWEVAFSPDGHRLASASSDGTVKLWNGTPTQRGTTMQD